MRVLFILGLLILVVAGLYLCWRQIGRALAVSAKDSPEVAEARGNLVTYARLQHERAESMAQLLRDIRAGDDVLPALSTDLRRRVDEALDR